MLRERIAALGSVPVGPQAVRKLAARPSAEARVATLGFEPRADDTFVRHRLVDLRPALTTAGITGAARPGAVARMCGVNGEAGAELGVLDIECLGLRGSGVVAFLVGAAVQRDTTLEVDQYLLVDLAAEAALLRAVASAIGSIPVWLTYNGRAFDIPVLKARCVVSRLAPESVQPRFNADVLGATRRLFRDRLGECTLQRAERSILQHHRVDDVPGAEAPARYRAWLNGAPASVFAGVVAHNLQDLVSTAVLAARLAAHVDGEKVSPAHAADGFHRARFLERRGSAGEAMAELRRTLEAGVEPWSRRAGHRLAQLLQRRGDHEAALVVWRRLHESDARDLVAARGFAIRLEHSRAYDDALRVCDTVSALRGQLGPRWPHIRGGGAAADGEWERRQGRLRRRRGDTGLGSARAGVVPLGERDLPVALTVGIARVPPGVADHDNVTRDREVEERGRAVGAEVDAPM